MCAKPPTIAIALEFTDGADPISGQLRQEGGARPFTGWLELVAALESALAESSARTDPPEE